MWLRASAEGGREGERECSERAAVPTKSGNGSWRPVARERKREGAGVGWGGRGVGWKGGLERQRGVRFPPVSFSVSLSGQLEGSCAPSSSVRANRIARLV